MDAHVLPLVDTFLERYGIAAKKDADQVRTILARHLDALLFNVTSLSAIIALMKKHKKVDTKDLPAVLAYLHLQCPLVLPSHTGGQSGGSLPIEYFGGIHGAYNASHLNEGVHTSVTTLESMIRPDHGPNLAERMSGGAASGGHVLAVFSAHTDFVYRYMDSVLAHHGNMSISTNARKELMGVLDRMLGCVAQEVGASTTSKKLHALFTKKRFAVFR